MKISKSTRDVLIALSLIGFCGFSINHADAAEFSSSVEDSTLEDDLSDIYSIVSESFDDAVDEGVRLGWAAYAGAWSTHLKTYDDYTFNENHELLALEYDRFVFGHMKNSYGDSTWLAAYDWGWYQNSVISVGALMGVSYGYDKDKMVTMKSINFDGWVPFGAPYVGYTGFLKEYNVEPRIAVLFPAVAITVRYEF